MILTVRKNTYLFTLLLFSVSIVFYAQESKPYPKIFTGADQTQLYLSKLKGKNIAIVFSNNASSLESDRKHQNSINDKENYYPSPAIFVYTLPNIGIGEISIRHQLKSENGFFVFENYNANFHYNYEKSLINNNKSESVLGSFKEPKNTSMPIAAGSPKPMYSTNRAISSRFASAMFTSTTFLENAPLSF